MIYDLLIYDVFQVVIRYKINKYFKLEEIIDLTSQIIDLPPFITFITLFLQNP